MLSTSLLKLTVSKRELFRLPTESVRLRFLTVNWSITHYKSTLRTWYKTLWRVTLRNLR